VTQARLRPRLREFGITRVANVTGLDRIGIPVCMVIRPNSRSLSVSQGKGLTADAAWVSGVMEAIELWHAESPQISLRLASRGELAREARVVCVDRLSVRAGVTVHEDLRLLWATGTDLISHEPMFVPYALVHVNAVPPFPPGDEYFDVTSNGLASGSVPPEAVMHALCELIERDSLSRWRNLSAEAMARSLMNLASVDSAEAHAAIALCERAELKILALDMTSELGLPAVICVLLDERESAVTLRGASMGFGCHLRRDTAFIRALTEAAQSRLTLIAGSRDDIDRQDYESRRRHREGVAWYRRLLDTPPMVDFRDLPDYRSDDFDNQLQIALNSLKRAGFDEVVAVDLTKPGTGLSVVRVVVPGLAPPGHAH
jgi:YcaO-like protein with predicted kinase domain